MVTTDIADADTPFAEDVIRAASELGTRYYRFGAFKYAADKPYTAQLDSFKPRLAKLAALNARYQSCAIYHTHSGVGLVGASIWDLHEIMQGPRPEIGRHQLRRRARHHRGRTGRLDQQLPDQRRRICAASP